MQQYFAGHMIHVRLFFGVSGILDLAGTIFLFLVRRTAFYLISAGFVLTILHFLYQSVAEGFLDTMPKEAIPMFVIGIVICWGLSIAVICYVGYLYFSKFLR